MNVNHFKILCPSVLVPLRSTNSFRLLRIFVTTDTIFHYQVSCISFYISTCQLLQPLLESTNNKLIIIFPTINQKVMKSHNPGLTDSCRQQPGEIYFNSMQLLITLELLVRHSLRCQDQLNSIESLCKKYQTSVHGVWTHMCFFSCIILNIKKSIKQAN